jgi:hypothetical protein
VFVRECMGLCGGGGALSRSESRSSSIGDRKEGTQYS